MLTLARSSCTGLESVPVDYLFRVVHLLEMTPIPPPRIPRTSPLLSDNSPLLQEPYVSTVQLVVPAHALALGAFKLRSSVQRAK
jgi:hypothetical protein